MKKAIICMFLLLLMICQSACGQAKDVDSNEEIKNISASLKLFTFDDLMDRAEIIATIKIKEVVKEVELDLPFTLYKAELMYNKFNLKLDEIEVTQLGGSKELVNWTPLYKKDDVIIAFMAKANDEKYGELNGKYFTIGGSIWSFL